MKALRVYTALFLWTGLFNGASDPENALKLIEHKKNLIPVAIIGSGPAGLSAALPPARSGYHTVVFQGPNPLGQLNDAYVIENWPGVPKASGAITMKHLEEQVKSFGVHLVPLLVTGLDVTSWPYKLSLNDGTEAYALTIICATGSHQKKLGIQGEDDYWGKGLFSCGLCDGSYTQSKDTVVIGGGDFAIQRVLQLAPVARKVTLIVPEEHLKARKTMQEKIANLPNLSLLYNKELKEIQGTEKEITHIVIEDTKTKELSNYPTTSVFLSTGLTPNTDIFKGILPLEPTGHITLIPTSRNQHTPLRGIMAAGTVTDATYPQVGAIIGDGTKAGMDAVNWLSKWNFDGPARTLITRNVYTPPTVPHPLISYIKTKEEFNEVIKSPNPVLLEFYSPTCSTCKKMEGPLSSITEHFKKDLKVYKVERDLIYSIIESLDIQFIPAFLLFKKGALIKHIEGEIALPQLRSFINDTLAAEVPQKK